IMEKQQIVLASRDSGTVSGAAPAFFVILKQQQGNGKADQGILVANRDACALASSVSTPVKPRVKTCLPADCVSGGITVTLDNNSMWNEFYHRNTEMILTKQGRRMFPYCRYWITGLNSSQKYILVMDISPVDNHRYKWNGRWWEPSGKAEPHVLGRVFIHPESPSTGQFWMHQPVSFYKLKLTNNTLDQEGHIILHSMHRYLPRLHLVPANKATEVIQLNGPDVHTFTFPQTEFFAVTAYQNIQITQLKIDYNPFAKGFRDDGLNSRPQRDVKQNSNLELEGGDVFGTPGICGRPAEVDALDVHQRGLDSSFVGQNPSDIELEKESFNAEGDFLGLLDGDLPSGAMPKLKQEDSESSYESNSCVASPLDPNGHFNVVIKEEPVDDYDYESKICTQGITVKQEDTDETDEYSNTDDDDPIVQKHLMRRRETDGIDGEFRSRKRILTSPSGVAKAKMLKLDSGKMPVVYLEPCAVTKSTVKISELPQTMLSSCKKDKSPLSAILDSLPVCFENHKDSCSGAVTVPEELVMKRESPGSKMSQKYCSIGEAQWVSSKSPNFNPRGSVTCGFPDKEICARKRPGVLKNPMSLKGSGNNQTTLPSVTNKRGRPRKLKISKAGRPPKGMGKTVVTSKNTSLGPGNTLPDVKPDLEDVDGVLFVSFASKVKPQSCESHSKPFKPFIKYPDFLFPNILLIDLKYLGVQLPLSYSNYSLWSYPGTNPSSPDTGFPFVSRTGKTNDFTKIKGWRGKLHGASRNEGGSSEGSLKNRSAFCSDKLDEYLENEGKLMETSMGFSSNTPTSPVVYQLPTKSTSYVRTLDSVLKKQSTVIPSTSYTFKPVPPSSTSRKTKTQTRQTSTNSRGKSSYKPILPSPFPAKQKQNSSASGEKAAKSTSSLGNQADGFGLSNVDENTFPKQISLRQAPQHHQAARPPGLSKSQVKLMDLEDCALWDGKPRTYITEERADISLATLLTAQASLKNKPIHKIIRRRAPPCNNDFCRLGCVCASLALEKRQPTHCRRPDCMFGCTCLKRRVLLVKGGSKHKKMMKKAVRGNLVLFGTQGQQQEDEDVEEGDGEEEEMKQKDRKKRKRVEYTICDSEPEQPVRNCPLWVKVEGEVDPEPIYVPTPSVIEPVKSMALPNPEILLSNKNRSSSGAKSGRVYTPRPNPIREEDKDPVYMYFESLMTCARVRAYEHRKEEKKQQKDKNDSQSCIVKVRSHTATSEVDKDTNKSGEKSWCSSRSEGDSFSTSCVHHATQGEPTKLIEIISDCNLEEDHNKILTILSQHINSNAPQCLKVGSFFIELASEYKAQDENHPPVCSSRVKISVPSYQDKDEKPEIPVLEIPDSAVPSCNNSENVKVMRAEPVDKLREKLHWGKGLPFYAGVSPAGKLVVYKCKANMSPSGLIQVAPSAKTPASGTPSVQEPPTSAPKTTSSSSTSTPTVTTLKTHVPAEREIEDAVPQAANKTPPKIAPGTDKRVGPRLLLIPVHQTPSALRPLNNTQLAQRQRMVLQPLRSPGAVNLFRHPNGQIIQLVPLQQVRAAGAQPSVQPVMLRNPGSVVGIRLPAPSKLPESPVSPTSSVSSTSPAANSAVQTAVPKLSPPSNPATQASSLLPSVTSFVSQAGTLTLRISSSAVSNVTNQTPSECKLSCSSGGLPATTANLIPLQSGSFALLQLPGQKTVPNSILHHFASLQMKKDYRKICKKEDSDAAQQKENGKALCSGDIEVTESEVSVRDGKQEHELMITQSNAGEESASGTVTPSGDRHSTTLEMVEKNSKVLEKDVQTEMKEDSRASSGQLHSQQEQNIQVKIKEEERESELFQNKQEGQGDASQPDMERMEYKGSTEVENIGEETRSRSGTASAKEQANASGEEHAVSSEEGKGNIARHEIGDSKEEGAFDSLEEMKTGHDILTHVNSSWSKISSIVPPLESRSEVDNKADRSEKSDFLTAPEQRARSKGYMPTIDITADDTEEDEEEDEEEEEEDEKTDDSADEMLDGASDFPSEEEVDVEKVDACEYREDDEQVDIETVEELSEKINIARLKATAAHIEPCDQKYHPPNSSDETLSEKHSKVYKHQTWKRKLKSQAEAFAHYRQTHTANERRRRNEMRGLFDTLKRVLGLQNLPKVSKCYILKQAFEEIQGLTDQADKFIGQKTLLTRKRDGLIRKVSTLSGKTEEVVLKKLEYIYAKQKAIEAQKKKKEPEAQKPAAPTTASTQQGSSAPPREPTPIAMTNRRGKPLILARRGVRATEDSSASLTLTAASVVMTPQGQVLTLKSPLVPGQVAAVPSTLLQAELKPRGVGTTMTAQPESEDSFMMPKIVNVTSLAAEASTNLNLNRNKNSNATATAGTPTSEQSLAIAPLATAKSDSIPSEEKANPCLGDSGGDGRNTTGPTKVFFENKDALPQLWNTSRTKEPPESFSKKLCIGEFVGSQARRKDGDSGAERLKSKELSFRKLQIKDSRIEMELRKVTSAMEEADLDTSEILSSIEESDDTDETLTSLLNEIAFLNQQLNDDASAMSELPSSLGSDFSCKDAEARRGTASDLSTADGSSFQFGHLGGSFKDLSEVSEGGGSLSPLLLHLEDDDLSDGDKNSGEPSSEGDVLKIVIGSEMKNPLSNLSITSGGNGKTVTTLSDATNVTPPVLQMKANPEASNADTSWRPMPKLAPLGLKVASLPVDSEGQSNKVMPLLAPVVAKLAPSGVKNILPATLQEGQDNKVMPTLAPVVVKLNTAGTLPSNSAGK
uniref:MAX gene-associated protein n=1 Tax=Malurus cyaneus samueli TaxID=2593467 RepID=A0A8C5UBF8_9PASS